MTYSDIESIEGPASSSEEALVEEVAYLRRKVQDLSKAEKALHESEERLRLIAATARCILWDAEVAEREDGTLAWSLKVWDEEAARRFLPVPMIEGAGFVPSWYESRVPEDKAKMDIHGSAELRAGRSYRQEFRCRMADGS